MHKSLFCLLLGISGIAFQNKTNITKWVIVGGCSLKVDGATNINNFTCGINNYSNPDTIIVDRRNNQKVQLNGSIQLDVQNFDCRNPVMTADLRKTLKVKEFPKLTVRFVSIDRYPNANAGNEITQGSVIIELAGISKRVDVDYKVAASNNNFINLVGSRRIHFSDFNIIPPRKLGGMIKTNDELSVEFNLKMKVLN